MSAYYLCGRNATRPEHSEYFAHHLSFILRSDDPNTTLPVNNPDVPRALVGQDEAKLVAEMHSTVPTVSRLDEDHVSFPEYWSGKTRPS